MRVLKRTYSPFVVSSATSQPYKISVYDIQTNSSHRTVVPNGSPYIPKSGVLENEYPFNPVSEPIQLPLAPQNINRIVLRIDEEASADIGIKSTTDFLIIVHILEKEPDNIEYGARIEHTTVRFVLYLWRSLSHSYQSVLRICLTP
jgi:hypothetical protein